MVKKILLFAGIILLFLGLSYGFMPELLQDKIVNQNDISGYVGMSKEAHTWDEAHPDDPTAWTNAMFGGMPTTMMTGNNKGDLTGWIYRALLTGKRPASYLFICLLGAFLLMLSLGVSPLIATGGAIAMAFCSYNFQIIQAGHNTKMQAIAFLPWVLAAVIYTYRSTLKKAKGVKTWLPQTALGAVLFGFALDMELKADHIQITYYLAIMIACYALFLFIWILTKKRADIVRFVVASALLLVLGFAGIGANANKLVPTWSYTKETMRGGSEIVAENTGQDKKDTGLDLDYATAWSYGWDELPNLMIPNYNGGSSVGELSMNSSTANLLKSAGMDNVRQIVKHLPLYWGPQPFTSGPMYMGAITIFLFLLGLMLCEGKDKWWMLAATLIAILLGVGYHFMGFTKFWFYHVPFYNKFRTVSMALVILQYTMPMLGFMVLDKIVRNKYDRKEFLLKGLIAFAITGGFCLLCILMPDIAGSFTGANDNGQADAIVDALRLDRAALMKKDAIVSFVLIAATFILLLWSYMGKEETSSTGKKLIAATSICILAVINMFTTDKRYLNSSDFVTPKEFNSQFSQRPVDSLILSDKELDYRVLDLTTDVFNSSSTSVWHKSIGGYSPVKLQRYQDLIDTYLNGEINGIKGAFKDAESFEDLYNRLPKMQILSMLNDKYIIYSDEDYPLINPRAMGNCWFVDSVIPAKTANEELALVGNADLHSGAIVRSEEYPSVKAAPGDSTDFIKLTSYAPNEMHYHYSAKSERLAVFSEVYYPDKWNAALEDGTSLDVFRTDWILRGLILPAGEHDIMMRFEPHSYIVGSNIAKGSSILLYLLLLLSAGAMIATATKKEEVEA